MSNTMAVDYNKVESSIASGSVKIEEFINAARLILNKDGHCPTLSCSKCPFDYNYCTFSYRSVVFPDRIKSSKEFLVKYDKSEECLAMQKEWSNKVEIKPFKINVNPNESRFVQKILFDNGYTWGGGSTEIKHTNHLYLYFLTDILYTGKPMLSYCDKDIYYADCETLTYKEFIEKYSKPVPYTKQDKPTKTSWWHRLFSKKEKFISSIDLKIVENVKIVKL